MTEHPLEHVDAPDSVDRCQGVAKFAQCMHRVVTGSKFCPMHGGAGIAAAAKVAEARMYTLAKWQARLGQFADHSQLKSLNQEIALARMTLEAIFNKCDDEHAVIMASGRIGDMLTRIEKLVVSAQRIEKATGQLLGKGSILQIAGEIVNIIDKHVADKSIVNTMANEIALVITRQADLDVD